MPKLPVYTLIKRASWQVEMFGGSTYRMQFRGPRIEREEKVLKNGTLEEIIVFVRSTLGESAVQDVMDEAVELQREQKASSS